MASSGCPDTRDPSGKLQKAAQAATDEAFDRMLSARADLRTAAQALDKRCTALAAKQQQLTVENGGGKASLGDQITLNVGGVRKRYTRETLRHFPNTKLAALFSGRWESKLQRDKKGRIFLDINPTCFDKLMDFILNSKLAAPDSPPPLPTAPPELQKVLARQVDFFGMSQLWAPTVPRGPTVPPLESLIINQPAHFAALDEWIDRRDLELLYRASRDGWQSTNFHSKCDNQGPTLTTISSTGGYIFGVFNDQPWSSSGKLCISDQAFLFLLQCQCNSVLPPTRAQFASAIFCHASLGPSFDSDDICIANSNVLRNCCTLPVGRIFQGPPPRESSISPIKCFLANEIEVHRISEPSNNRKARVRLARLVASSGCQGLGYAVEQALGEEELALELASERQTELEEAFEEEKRFVAFFMGETKDVVKLDVSGEIMCTKRSTLTLVGDSMLANKFDDQKEYNQGAANADDSDEDGELIEHSAYSFKVVIDHLRLRAMAGPDEPLLQPPRVRPDEQDSFVRMVKYLFPGHEKEFMA